jgi:hypothetical protein
MYHAAMRAPESELLQNEGLAFQETGFRYQLQPAAAGVTFSASDGTQTSTSPVTWAFGAGAYGQTYILERNGTYTEGRLSYFTRSHALDITPGQSSKNPHGTDEALGKKLDPETARLCFGCHTTGAIVSSHLETDKATPGVNCEACHGPGSAHVTAMRTQQNDQAPATMLNPKKLSPADSVDFCGACHRTWADVSLEMSPNIGVAGVRFQPYRLEKSRCWGKSGDPRITCMACHDPHQPLVHETSAYDVNCLACHAAQRDSKTHAAIKSCTVGTSNCVSCHMPKVEVPEAHATFTDHYIRVVARHQDQLR